jgi:hypothetical protein
MDERSFRGPHDYHENIRRMKAEGASDKEVFFRGGSG